MPAPAAEPVHDGDEVEEAAPHRDIGHVGATGRREKMMQTAVHTAWGRCQ